MPLKILAVENDPVDQTAFKRFIKREALAYEYDLVATVEAAQTLLLNNQYDIVLVDYSLDDGTGMQVLELVAGRTPTIFITGSGDEETAIIAMKHGASDYLIKDFDRGYLKLIPQVIDRALNTQKKQYQRNMLYHAIMSSSDCIIITDLNRVITFVNNAFCETYGYEADEIIGENCRILYETAADFENVIETTKHEVLSVRKDHSTFPTLITRSPIEDDDGRQFAFSMNVRDITEHRKLEQAAFELRVGRERLSILAEFIQNAAHEFRTPLAIINLSTSLMVKTNEQQKRQERAEQVSAQTDRITKLVDTLLFISKLKATTTLDKREININHLLESIVSDAQVKIPQLSIQLALTADLPTITGDYQYLHIALGHILENAIRFNTDEGSVKIRTNIIDAHVIVEIQDTGVGIGSEDLPEVFTLFWRADTAHTTPGFGVGLSIAKIIVEKHDGSIEIESGSNRGTLVSIKLPVLR